MSTRITHVLIAGLLTAGALTAAHAEATPAAAAPRADARAVLAGAATAGHPAHELLLDELAATGLDLRGIEDLDSRIGPSVQVGATGGAPPAIDSIVLAPGAAAAFQRELTGQRVSHLGYLNRGASDTAQGEPDPAKPVFGLRFLF